MQSDTNTCTIVILIKRYFRNSMSVLLKNKKGNKLRCTWLKLELKWGWTRRRHSPHGGDSSRVRSMWDHHHLLSFFFFYLKRWVRHIKLSSWFEKTHKFHSCVISKHGIYTQLISNMLFPPFRDVLAFVRIKAHHFHLI